MKEPKLPKGLVWIGPGNNYKSVDGKFIALNSKSCQLVENHQKWVKKKETK